MSAFIADSFVEQNLIQTRQAQGLDRWDEVWEGVYIVMPLPNNEHQELVGGIDMVLRLAVVQQGLGKVYPGANVSDRDLGWEFNYRCPDVAVYLNDNPATDCRTHWCGGPDLAIEIISPDDRSRDKLDFYESIGTREVLLIDRNPWQLELYRPTNGAMSPVGRCSLPEAAPLTSDVLPLTWRLIAGDPRPQIEITTDEGNERWLV